MIYRPNYELYRQYLKYLIDLGQHDPKSIQVKASRLKWVLRWADEQSLETSPAIRPTLPVYLAGIKEQPGRFHYVLVDARLFFRWLAQAYPRRVTPALARLAGCERWLFDPQGDTLSTHQSV